MLSFFPQAVLYEIWDLVKSVSEGFPNYSLCFLFCSVLKFELENK